MFKLGKTINRVAVVTFVRLGKRLSEMKASWKLPGIAWESLINCKRIGNCNGNWKTKDLCIKVGRPEKNGHGGEVEIAKGFCSSVQFLWQRSVDCWLILETNSPRLQTLTITSDAHPTDNEWLITIGLNSFFCEESYKSCSTGQSCYHWLDFN